MDLHLATDGALYFVELLDRHRFTDFDPSRTHSVYLTQWPIYLALKADVESVALLKFFFAVGIYFPYLLSMVACDFATRAQSRTLLLFPVLSIAAVNLPASNVLYGETQPAALLAWPVALLLLRERSWEHVDGAMACVLAFLWMKTQQASIAAAALCLLLLVARLKRLPQERSRAWGWMLLGLLLLQVCLMFYGILFPFNLGNRGHFLGNIFLTVFSLHFLVVAFLLVLILLGGLIGTKRSLLAACVLLGGPCLVRFAFLHQSILVSFDFAGSDYSSAYRTAVVTLLPALILAAALFAHLRVELSPGSRSVLLCLMLLTTVWQVYAVSRWNGYRSEYRAFLRQNSGFVSVTQTPMYRSAFDWHWTHPMLSVVWSAPVVNCIVLNEPDVYWQPYDPRERRVMERYLDYGPALASP